MKRFYFPKNRPAQAVNPSCHRSSR